MDWDYTWYGLISLSCLLGGLWLLVLVIYVIGWLDIRFRNHPEPRIPWLHKTRSKTSTDTALLESDDGKSTVHRRRELRESIQISVSIQSTTAPTHLQPDAPERSPFPHESPFPSPQTPSDHGSVTSQATVYSTLPPSYCSCRSELDLTRYSPLRPSGSGALRSLPSPPTSYDYDASRRETFRPRGPRNAGMRPNSRSRRSRAPERPRDEEEALAYDMFQLPSGRGEDSLPEPQARGVVDGRQRGEGNAALTRRQSSYGDVGLTGGPMGSYLNDSPVAPPPAYSENLATYDERTVSP
ncbi:hypothetical protein C8Q74DRAFT_984599 [Fomes fomentarius]|nr:hypothetical protein C8Q74DRAFT_984599 [Fomes fomentarius]